MPAGGFVVGDGQKTYPGKLTPYVVFTCVVAAMGGLIFGYDIGISGGVTSMPSFQKRFFPSVYRKLQEDTTTNHYCQYDSPTLRMFTSSVYLAAIISSLVASTVTRKFGRRLSMLFGGILFCAGALINGFAKHVWMLIVGRILLGFGMGFANQSVPLYLSEMAPYKYRGALNIGFQLSVTIGILVAQVLNYFFAKIKGGWGWRLSLGGAVVPALILILGFLVLPDTPISMIERGQQEEAKTNLRRIRGIDDVSLEFNDLVAASKESRLLKHPWRNLLRRKYRPHLTMAVMIPFFQQLTGISPMMYYAPVFFRIIGFTIDASLMSAMVTGSINVAATLVSIYGVDKWGRRFLFLEGGTQMLICQVVAAACIQAKFGVDGTLSELIPMWYAKVVVTFICIYVAGFAWSWGPLGWLVPSEIFPLEIRSAAQSITVSVNMIFTFIIAQIFLTMLCKLKFWLFLFSAFFVVVISIFVYIFLPETKGIPIEEMGQVWKSHWYWSRFVEDDEYGNRQIFERVEALGGGPGGNKAKLKELPLFEFQVLAAATDNFSIRNKLGQGGFGPVYKGRLQEGQEIAVKRLSRASGQGIEELVNEVVVISKLQHRNLVKLLGCCIAREERILVYEFMPKKSLDYYLFDPKMAKLLDLETRFNIINGICRGLLYLHRDSRLRIIHRDMKASNILLDENLIPKISDFGLARIFEGNEDEAKTRRVVGTYGYMAPEYAMGGQFSEKSDVFSLGVILLEIVSGQRNSHSTLLPYVWSIWNEGEINSLVDPEIFDQLFEKEIRKCVHIGLLCVQEAPNDRPSVSTVCSMLNSEIVDIPEPKQPAFISMNYVPEVESPEHIDSEASINNVTITDVTGR